LAFCQNKNFISLNVTDIGFSHPIKLSKVKPRIWLITQNHDSNGASFN